MNRPGTTGLNYFGTMTTTATHDLKNVIAIINENAGLLGDLTQMARRNQSPLAPERVGQVAGRIQDQVKRADDLLKNLNRFAHSVDTPMGETASCDLEETVGKTLELAARLIAMKGVGIKIIPPEAPVYVHHHPFLLGQAVWDGVAAALETAGGGEKLTLTLASDCLWIQPGDWTLEREENITRYLSPFYGSREGVYLIMDSTNKRFGLTWAQATL